MVYLDNAATTKIHPDVLKAMMPYLTTEYGNAGTKYEFGRTAAKAIETARKNVADFIGAKEGQIIFTSSGSEANNMAILGVLDYLRFSDKKRILISSVEHDSVIKAANAAEKALCHSSENNIKDRFHVEYIRVALWCMFAQVFPLFQDASRFTTIPIIYADGFMDPSVRPTAADPTMQGVVALIALAANVLCLAVIIKRAKEQKKNPYKNEIFTDQRDYRLAMERAE